MGYDDIWSMDEREIRSVELANGARFESLAAARFERFERNGEMAAVPWIRIHDGLKGRIIEAPLRLVQAIEYAPTPTDRLAGVTGGEE